MARTEPGTRSVCPVAYALDVFGDQWSLLIVRDLLLSRRRAFQELVNAPEGIATNVLADRLERLTDLGVVVAAVDPDDGRRRSYFLTDKGLALFPVKGLGFGPISALEVSPVAVAGSLMIALLVGLTAGIWPAYQALRLRTVDALRRVA